MQIPAAWHPDPTGTHDHRWWDGERWTEHVADAGVASIDPLPDSRDAASAATSTADTPATGTPDTETPDTDVARDAAADAPDTDATRQLDLTPADEWADDVDDRAASEPTTVMGRTAEEPAPAATGAAAQPTWGSDAAWPQTTTLAGSGQQGASGLAITALVLGILSIPLGLILLGGLLGIAAIICGAIASSRAKRGQAGGRGIAIGGVISGVIGLVITAIILVFAVRIGVEMTRCLDETGGDQQVCMQRLEQELTDRFTAAA